MPAHLRDAAALPALAASLAIAGPACAADGEWQISPYLWIAGFEGTVGGAGGDSNTGDRKSVV